MSTNTEKNTRNNAANLDERAEKYRAGIKRELMEFIRDRLYDMGTTQMESAELLGVSQARISQLENLHMDKFRVDMLLTMAYKLGYEFQLSLLPPLK